MNSELRAISCLKGQRSCPNQIQSIALHYLRSSNNQSDLPLCLRPVPPFSISSIHGNSTLDCDPSDLLDPSTALILHLLTPTLCLVLASWTFLHHYLARNNTPLRSVPGPWFASCSILYRFYFAVILGSWHHKSIALHKQYGPIVRITPTEVSVSDPAVIPEIYAHVDRAYPKCDM